MGEDPGLLAEEDLVDLGGGKDEGVEGGEGGVLKDYFCQEFEGEAFEGAGLGHGGGGGLVE